MKLLLNGRYQEVGFWSFMKCAFLVHLALMGIVYGVILLLALAFY